MFEANPNVEDSDPDGDPITVVAVNGEAEFQNGSVQLASGALLTIAADGTFTYDPAGKFETLSASDTTTDSFNYTISDGIDGYSTATAFVSIQGLNDAPVPGNERIRTDEDTVLTINVSDLLENDVDVDVNDTLRIVGIETDQTLGDAYMPDGDTIIYDPTVGLQWALQNAGAGDSLRYIVEDSAGARAKATIVFEVIGRNDTPIANADQYSTTEDAPIEIFISDILSNDEDPDIWAQISFVSLDDTQTQGTVSYQGGTSFTYTPTGSIAGLGAGMSATDTVLYTITDQYGAQSTNAVLIDVEGLNDAIIISAEELDGSVTEDATAGLLIDSGTISIFDGDLSDQHEVSLGLVSSTHGELGAFSVNIEDAQPGDGNKSVVWTYEVWNDAVRFLADGEKLQEVYQITIEDPAGSIQTRQVTITINGTNFAPTAIDDSSATISTAAVQIDVLSNDADPDGDALSVSQIDGGADLAAISVNADNTVTYDPAGAFAYLAAGESAADQFIYTVSDGNGGTDTAVVEVTITGDTTISDSGSVFQFGLPGMKRTKIGFDGDDFYLQGRGVDRTPVYKDADNVLAKVIELYGGTVLQQGMLNDQDLPKGGVNFALGAQPTLVEISGSAVDGLYQVSFAKEKTADRFLDFLDRFTTEVAEHDVVATDGTDFRFDAGGVRLFFDDQNDQFGFISADGAENRFGELETYVEGVVTELGGVQTRDADFDALGLADGTLVARALLNRNDDLVIKGSGVDGRFKFDLDAAPDPAATADGLQTLFDKIGTSGAIGFDDIL